MATYTDTQYDFIESRLYSTLRGIPLHEGPYDRWFPIRPCLCVTAENCPCDRLDDIIIWLPPDAIPKKTGSMCEGQELFTYRLETDAEILVETQIPTTINELERLKEVAEGLTGPTYSAFRRTSVMMKKPKKKTTVGTLVVAAFELGWKIGEKINEETGLDDKISDWLSENFPWPWR